MSSSSTSETGPVMDELTLEPPCINGTNTVAEMPSPAEARRSGEPADEWLSISEVAEYLRVSKSTVSNLRVPRSYVGRLPRFRKADIDQYLKDRMFSPPEDQSATRQKIVAAHVAQAIRTRKATPEERDRRRARLLDLFGLARK